MRKSTYFLFKRLKELSKIGLSGEGLDDLLSRGRAIRAEVSQRMEDRRRDYNREKIRESRYCPQYKDLSGVSQRSRYIMDQKLRRQDKVKVARWRLGNEVKAAEFWRREEEKVCRLCGVGLETMHPLVQECVKCIWKDRRWTVKELLREDGSGLTGIGQIETVWKGKRRGASEDRT